MSGTLLPLLAVVAGMAPEARIFGLVPPPCAVRRGEEAAWRRRPPADFATDRTVIGRWFDGGRQVGTEDAFWVSPRWVAARLGYLSVEEEWPDAEIQRRWELIRRAMGGRQVVLVRTSAFPRQPSLEIGVGAPADPRFLNIGEVRIAGAAPGPLAATQTVRTQRVRRRDEIQPTPVWDVAPEFAALAPRGRRGPPTPSIGVGDWWVRDTLVRFPASAAWRGDVEVLMSARGRERRAVFSRTPDRRRPSLPAGPLP